MAKDGDAPFNITLENFHKGLSPMAHLNSLTEFGADGHASSMKNVDVVSVPDYMTQGPALSNLTNGDQDGLVDELINHILEIGTDTDESFAIGDTKLFRLTPTSVSNATGYPHTITDATEGNGLAYLLGKVYYFFNKSSGGDIGELTLSSDSFDDNFGTTGSHGNTTALEKAKHPTATKEDLMLFGNGRYLGKYVANSDTLEPQQLDFGDNHEVADIEFSRNQWWIAVNGGFSGSERNIGRIVTYDGSAIGTILSDETGVGLQEIGFLFVDNGTVWVAYKDLSMTAGFKLGFISGSTIKPLVHFSGSLPDYTQKTLYKNTIAFVSGGEIYSAGAIVNELQIQISQIAPGGHSTVGAIAAPFGTPLVASSDGGSNHRLAEFSSQETDCTWRSPIIPMVQHGMVGTIDRVEVITNSLDANARCDLKIEYDQQSTSSKVLEISGENKIRHVFKGLAGKYTDFNVFLDWSNGNASDDCRIRKILIKGHYVPKE